jgi:3'-5' exoribonuclease
MGNKQHFDHEIYFIRQKELKQAKTGQHYLKLELCRDGFRMFGHLWKAAKQWHDALHFASVVEVTGSRNVLNGHSFLRIDEIKHATVDQARENPVVSKPNLRWLENQISSVGPEFQHILKHELTEQRKIKLCLFPAGKLWAFRHEGGLLERLKRIVSHLDAAGSENLNQSLVRTAMLLQAIGYVEGMYNNGLYEYRTNAKLLTIPVVALCEVGESLNSLIKSKRDRLHLQHLILTMPIHSEREKDHKPKSLEAILFYNIQLLVREYAAVLELKNKEDNINRKWSSYNKQLDRFLYLGNNDKNKA